MIFTWEGYIILINSRIINHLSRITDEEKHILSGQAMIDRNIYMSGDRDIISGDKLLPKGKQIMIRPHTRFIKKFARIPLALLTRTT